MDITNAEWFNTVPRVRNKVRSGGKVRRGQNRRSNEKEPRMIVLSLLSRRDDMTGHARTNISVNFNGLYFGHERLDRGLTLTCQDRI